MASSQAGSKELGPGPAVRVGLGAEPSSLSQITRRDEEKEGEGEGGGREEEGREEGRREEEGREERGRKSVHTDSVCAWRPGRMAHTPASRTVLSALILGGVLHQRQG